MTKKNRMVGYRPPYNSYNLSLVLCFFF